MAAACVFDVQRRAGLGTGNLLSLKPSIADDLGRRFPGAGATQMAKYPFTNEQLKEVERQAMIYNNYIVSSRPVPPHLLFPVSAYFPSLMWHSRNGDPEPGRCKRTDGKKWRCSKEVAVQQKYCERHLHRGRARSRKPVKVDNVGKNRKKARGLEPNRYDRQLIPHMFFYWVSSLIFEHDDGDIGVGALKADFADGEGQEDLTLSNSDAHGGGEPADAFLFALAYLGVKDLLTVERVCKLLFDDVRDETLVWKNITIDYPLRDKITDHGLLRLTNWANGTLCSLSLLKCVKITNAGLKQVLERNPRLTKKLHFRCVPPHLTD